MEHSKRKLTKIESILISKVAAKMDLIQKRIDGLMRGLAESKVSEAHRVKDAIRLERANLIPYANLKSGIASTRSRSNYFPQHMDIGEASQAVCSDRFIKYVESQV